MAQKNENFPNALEGFFLFLALLLAEFVVASVLFDMNGQLGMDPLDLNVLVLVIANGIIFTVVMEHKQLSYRELFHASPTSKRATLLVTAPAIALTIPALFLSLGSVTGWLAQVFPPSDWELAYFASLGSGSIAAVLLVCILAPVLEEMLFRGIVLRSFLQQYPKWTAIVGSATLFGFAHLNLYQFVCALMLGIFLGWLYERTQSLLPCIWLHGLFNASWVVLDWPRGRWRCCWPWPARGGSSRHWWGDARHDRLVAAAS